MIGEKVCSACQFPKPMGDFYPNADSPDGYRSKCKACDSLRAKKYYRTTKTKQVERANFYYQNHKEERRAYRRTHSRRYQDAQLRRKYHITLEDYERMAILQGNKCAICGALMDGLLCVDHNHITGKVRGLLCNLCNLVVGNSRENPETLIKAANYLVQWQTTPKIAKENSCEP